MGQNSSSFPNHDITFKSKSGNQYTISYHALVEHIILLRKVIQHPEMTTQGPILDSYINNYRKRMAQGRLRTENQQSKLPWQIEWIWHVHRLHSLEYLIDCESQLTHELVDKQTGTLLLMNNEKTIKLKRKCFSKDYSSLFVPSIDLTKAILRQKDFLNNFQKHFLSGHDLHQLNRAKFRNLVNDYYIFVQSAKQGETIVPTFDVDLIWHTHMRYPLDYQNFSKIICGFILNYDDSIEQSITLNFNTPIIGDRWKVVSQPKLNRNIDGSYSKTTECRSSYGTDFTSACTTKPIQSHTTNDGGYTINWNHTHTSYDVGSSGGSSDSGVDNDTKGGWGSRGGGDTKVGCPSVGGRDSGSSGDTKVGCPSVDGWDSVGGGDTKVGCPSVGGRDSGSSGDTKVGCPSVDGWNSGGGGDTKVGCHSVGGWDSGGGGTTSSSNDKHTSYDVGSSGGGGYTSSWSDTHTSYGVGSSGGGGYTSSSNEKHTSYDVGSSGGGGYTSSWNDTHTSYDVGSSGGGWDSGGGGDSGGGDSGGGGGGDGGGGD